MNQSHYNTKSKRSIWSVEKQIQDLKERGEAIATSPRTVAQLPRTIPCPTDQRSDELKDPALSAFLDSPNDDTDIDFAPVPPDPAPALCPHCQRPLRDEDTALARPLATEHGLPPHLCLNCTLEELEVLAPYTEAQDGLPVVFAALLAA